MKHQSLFKRLGLLTLVSVLWLNVSSQKVAKPAVSDNGSIFMDEVVVISTSYGDIKLKLYKDTPMHSDNFLKLAREGFFDGTLFHRVIEGFMIQGGDPDSKGAKPGIELGNGGPGYDIEAEIMPGHLHKRGALAAARESDDVNPKKLSSGSQFYIVQGKKFSDYELDMVEKKQFSLTKQRIFVELMKKPENAALSKEFFTTDSQKDSVRFKFLLDTINGMLDKEYALTTPFVISPDRREIYRNIGGAPHLDGNYTIFGEVISGMDVVDRIAAVRKDEKDRPLEDLPMRVYISDEKNKK